MCSHVFRKWHHFHFLHFSHGKASVSWDLKLHLQLTSLWTPRKLYIASILITFIYICQGLKTLQQPMTENGQDGLQFSVLFFPLSHWLYYGLSLNKILFMHRVSEIWVFTAVGYTWKWNVGIHLSLTSLSESKNKSMPVSPGFISIFLMFSKNHL